MARPKTNIGKYITLSIRLPEELHTTLQELATKEERSLNWMISHLLQQVVENLQEQETFHS